MNSGGEERVCNVATGEEKHQTDVFCFPKEMFCSSLVFCVILHQLYVGGPQLEDEKVMKGLKTPGGFVSCALARSVESCEAQKRQKGQRHIFAR